jgi:hypothetical protein
LTRDASPRLGSLFIALSTVLFGSLGVATKGIFQLAKTNALSVTLMRAAIALPALAAMCAMVQGRRMFRIAAGDLRRMAVAGLMMALYQAAFVVAITHGSVRSSPWSPSARCPCAPPSCRPRCWESACRRASSSRWAWRSRAWASSWARTS